jgi:hypothetical protein
MTASLMKPRIKILLGKTQIQQLRPYLDRVQAAAALGSPGMLVAQISWDQEGKCWLVPAFLNHTLAKIITERGLELEKTFSAKEEVSA